MAAANILATYSNDADQINRIFSNSALMRPKWDRPQSGSTYGRITIAKALASARQYRQSLGGLRPEQIKSVFVQASPQQLLPGPPAAAQPTQTAITPAMVLQRQYGTPISAAELEKMPFPPLRFLIDGMLTEGVAILAAAPKIGKSWLCLDLCTAIASGTPFWGRQTSQSEVLYLALEDGQRRLQSRLRKILQGNSFPAGLYLATAAPNTGAGLYR